MKKTILISSVIIFAIIIVVGTYAFYNKAPALEVSSSQVGSYVFTKNYTTRITVGGIVDITNKTYHVGDVVSGKKVSDGINISIAPNSSVNDGQSSNASYQEFITVPVDYLAPSGNGQISQTALDEIATLEKGKASQTPTENKLSSHILDAFKINAGISMPYGIQQTGVTLDSQNRVLVDINANISDALLSYIKSLNGEVVNSFVQQKSILAYVPLAKIEELAGRSDVIFIKPPAVPELQ